MTYKKPTIEERREYSGSDWKIEIQSELNDVKGLLHKTLEHIRTASKYSEESGILSEKVLSVKNDIHDLIKKIEDKAMPPNDFIFEGVVYRKDFDGLFHLYPVGAEFKKENSIGDCSISEAENILNSKFRKEIFYCTNDVTKKL